MFTCIVILQTLTRFYQTRWPQTSRDERTAGWRIRPPTRPRRRTGGLCSLVIKVRMPPAGLEGPPAPGPPTTCYCLCAPQISINETFHITKSRTGNLNPLWLLPTNTYIKICTQTHTLTYHTHKPYTHSHTHTHTHTQECSFFGLWKFQFLACWIVMGVERGSKWGKEKGKRYRVGWEWVADKRN